MERSCRSWAMLMCCVVTATATCCQAGPHEVDLSWRLADGRACDVAGVASVDVWVQQGPQAFRCQEGMSPAAVSIPMPEAPTEITVEGVTTTGAVLYRGSTTAEPGQSSRTTVLRFVGGRPEP